MLSARSQVSVRPLYGVEEFRKSRSMAGGMTGGLVLLALAVCLMTPSVKLLTPPKAPSSTMLMRVIRPEPTPEAKPVQPDAMRRLLSPESEVTIPVPPPVVERPKPPQEAPKTVPPEPVKPKSETHGEYAPDNAGNWHCSQFPEDRIRNRVPSSPTHRYSSSIEN